MTLGDYISAYRAENRVTMREFAAKSGLSLGYISMLEKNKNPKTGEKLSPSLDTYKAVAKAVGIDAAELICDVDDDIVINLPPIDLKNAIPFEYNHMAPVLGKIPAGYPAYADNDVLGYEAVNVPNPEECFWLIVDGDSMIDAGIEPGDHVLIRKQPTADNGAIVACRVNGDDATLKRIAWQGDSAVLYPANAKYHPIVVPRKDFEDGNASVYGVVIQLSRHFPIR